MPARPRRRHQSPRPDPQGKVLFRIAGAFSSPVFVSFSRWRSDPSDSLTFFLTRARRPQQLDDLQSTHLHNPLLVHYPFAAQMALSIPDLRHSIRDLVTGHLKAWMFEAREASRAVGKGALDAMEQRGRRWASKKRREVNFAVAKINGPIELSMSERHECESSLSLSLGARFESVTVLTPTVTKQNKTKQNTRRQRPRQRDGQDRLQAVVYLHPYLRHARRARGTSVELSGRSKGATSSSSSSSSSSLSRGWTFLVSRELKLHKPEEWTLCCVDCPPPQAQAGLLLSSTSSSLTPSFSLSALSTLLEDIVGFFLIESHVLRTTDSFRSEQDVEDLWDEMCDRVVEIVDQGLAACQEAEVFLGTKFKILTFVQTLEVSLVLPLPFLPPRLSGSMDEGGKN